MPLLFGALWFVFASDSSGYVLSASALASVAGFTLQRSRARAQRRRAALDVYAEREIARMSRPRGPASRQMEIRRARLNARAENQEPMTMRRNAR